MKDNNILSWIASGVTWFTAAVSSEHVLQVVLLVFGIISSVVSLGYNIYVWYKKASEDGKITKEEIAEAADMVNKTVNDINTMTGGNKDGKKD